MYSLPGFDFRCSGRKKKKSLVPLQITSFLYVSQLKKIYIFIIINFIIFFFYSKNKNVLDKKKLIKKISGELEIYGIKNPFTEDDIKYTIKSCSEEFFPHDFIYNSVFEKYIDKSTNNLEK